LIYPQIGFRLRQFWVCVVNEAKHKLLHGSVMAPLANWRDELFLDIGSPDSLVLAKAAVGKRNRADKLQLNF
jgi:hypothetical protein